MDLVLRLTMLSELLLIACTWRLWFGATAFPRVPISGVFLSLPSVVLPITSSVLSGCLIVALLFGRNQRRGPAASVVAAAACCGLLAVGLNQHCLQAWHWLCLLILSLRLLLPAADLMLVLRRLLPCIYIFAAVSRLGPSMDTGIIPQIVRTLLDLAGLPTLAANPQTLSRLCVAVSLIELLVGLLLLFPRTRRPGMAAAFVMHLTLLAVFSPWGLRQQMAVLVWNASLAATVLVVYGGSPRLPRPAAPVRVTVATGFLFLWPTLALVGITDNWTGWQLYSPRPEVLQVQVHADSVTQLPDGLIPHVSEPLPLQDWCNVRLDRWSLQTVGVPLYPQARFQLAVAVAATSGIHDTDHVRATLTAPDSPRWWTRVKTEWTSQSQLVDALADCRFAAVRIPERQDSVAGPTAHWKNVTEPLGDRAVLDSFE